MTTFQDQVAIITGGAAGIGGATARRLASEGARVLIADINLTAAQANVARIQAAGGVAEAIETDVGQHEAIKAMIARAVSNWGRLDILVNNAWVRTGSDGSAVTLPEDAWDHSLNVMVKAHYLAAKYAVPAIEKQGKGAIINIASVHGLLMAPRKLSYETAKSAVIGLTRQMALDFGPLGIRVNAICPGHIVNERLEAHWQQNPSLFKFFEAQYPVGRVGQPDDIANAIRFLCSDEATFITGQALVVDGGLSIQLQEDFGIKLAQYYRDHPETQLPE